MNFNRIKGLFLQELFISFRSYEIIIDIILSPVISLILFGFLTLYLTGQTNVSAAYSLLSGALLWNIVFIIQYSVSVGSLWNVWSRNLSNMFTTPISKLEYLFTYFISGFIKSMVIFFILVFVSSAVFHFNLLEIGTIPLILYIINLAFFAVSIGIFLLGLVFRFGTRIQAFSWGVLPIFQVLSASFYPVSVLPVPLQYISRALPTTYVFESMRESLIHPNTFIPEYIQIAFILNVIYFIFCSIGFVYMFSQSKNTGQFAKLDG